MENMIKLFSTGPSTNQFIHTFLMATERTCEGDPDCSESGMQLLQVSLSILD